MEVKIYTTPTCQYCKMAKAYFKEHKIDVKEIDVSDDTAKQKEMIDKSGQMGVPVIIVEHHTGREEGLVGFDKAKLDALYESHK